MALRNRLRRFELAARDEIHSYETLDGGIVYYDFNELGGALFVHGVELLTLYEDEDPPEPPEIVRKVLQEAAHPKEVLARFKPEKCPEQGGMFDPTLLLSQSREDSF
jgi:hypothetical protein